MNFNKQDLLQIEENKQNTESIAQQIENFKNGFPFINLDRPALLKDGIIKLNQEELNTFIKIYDSISTKESILKFVPASGAASRMFKDLFSFINEDKTNDSSEEIIEKIKSLALFNDLKEVLNNNGKSVENADEKTIISAILLQSGLNYGNLPKGLLKFHNYKEGERTSTEEHLVEAASYAKGMNNICKLHLTVSEEFMDLFKNHIKEIAPKYENAFDVRYEVEFSVQKPSTDIIAVDLKNEPFRNSDNSLLFRPGGHGALIENLNQLEADIVFIKNIDNVVPDHLKEETINYKKAIAGVLVDFRNKTFELLNAIENNKVEDQSFIQIREIFENFLHIKTNELSEEDLIDLAKEKFNRPIRVCGMVRNEGEPGGGPFWVKQQDGTCNLQIVESAQIDLDNPQQKEIVSKASHFNPVDLVCSLRNFKGEKFDLPKYRDNNTGFISKKSKDGKELKAQELPGLWNGAMADWNTLFVEVPLITFNPVKTINDLLREEHQMA